MFFFGHRHVGMPGVLVCCLGCCIGSVIAMGCLWMCGSIEKVPRLIVTCFTRVVGLVLCCWCAC